MMQGEPVGKCALEEAYTQERTRLFSLAACDTPQGEYHNPVFGEGKPSATIMLIGEAPGAEETKLGHPFVGKAGKQLDALFCKFGVMREDAFITNVVKYRPVVRSEKSTRNRTPQPAEVKASLPLLKIEILHLSPKLILTLGNTPLKAVFALAGQKPPVIGVAHGKQHSIVIEGETFTLIPLYHPASGIYNRTLVEVMEQDAAFVGSVVQPLKA
ncbi:MAG: uracil-DNA glycosylase [Firmicutes bacterium HGW-Firmicutes-9]|jgi:DNA polymerase|nr:MAG: uracil-DNA glycosylase [Firmicutes bacterium HGW-Firmicutes-9]